MLHYDTAIYSRSYLAKREDTKNNVLIYYDPFIHDVWDHFAEKSKFIWTNFIDYQLKWASNNRADIYVVDSGDKSSLMEKGVSCRFVTDLEWMAGRLSGANAVLTPKVHQAVLAKVMGCRDVTLLPVDSRAYTVVPLGITVKPVGFDMPDMDFGIDHFSVRKTPRYAKKVSSWIKTVFP